MDKNTVIGLLSVIDAVVRVHLSTAYKSPKNILSILNHAHCSILIQVWMTRPWTPQDVI